MVAHVTRQVSPRMGLALHAPSAMDLKGPVAEPAGYTTFGSAQRGHLESRRRRDGGLDLLGRERQEDRCPPAPVGSVAPPS
jgi:hypothetical protein